VRGFSPSQSTDGKANNNESLATHPAVSSASQALLARRFDLGTLVLSKATRLDNKQGETNMRTALEINDKFENSLERALERKQNNQAYFEGPYEELKAIANRVDWRTLEDAVHVLAPLTIELRERGGDIGDELATKLEIAAFHFLELFAHSSEAERYEPDTTTRRNDMNINNTIKALEALAASHCEGIESVNDACASIIYEAARQLKVLLDETSDDVLSDVDAITKANRAAGVCLDCASDVPAGYEYCAGDLCIEAVTDKDREAGHLTIIEPR
jgi:hypothetical protein